jgi:hypothetical protein
VPGTDFGRDRRIAHRKLVDREIPDGFRELFGELGAVEQAGAAEAEVEIAEQTAPGQAARPFLDRVEFAGGVAAADHGPDRGAGDDVRRITLGEQRLDHADVGKAARRTAAEHETDARPGWRRFGACMRVRIDGLFPVLSVTPKNMKHANQVLDAATRSSPRTRPQCKSYAPVW